MNDATGESMSVQIAATHAGVQVLDRSITECTLTASGRTITFPGFLKAYVEAHDDPDETSDDSQARLPQLTVGTGLDVLDVVPAGHETRPPARYTEPSLVAKLEELEIGRPSTYASILRTITSRDYVFKKGSALVPTWLAFAVTRLLEEHFGNLVDYAFTADMEQTLDEIANGGADRKTVLSDFYFGTDAPGDEGLRESVTELGDIDARALSSFPVPGDPEITIRVGRYGTYIETTDGRRANVAEDLPPDELTAEYAHQLLDAPVTAERELGTTPDTNLPVVAKDGRYGPYVTEVLAEDAPKNAKARTGSLFKSMSIDTVTLEDAMRLLSLPRVVGEADGEPITAQNGRYGPYLKKGTDSRSLTTEDQIFDVTLEEALAIYAQPKLRGRAAAAAPLKELGNDPVTGTPMVVKSGRFGPYVTDGTTNATLRKDDEVDDLTPERAAELLADKRAKGPAPKKAPVRRAPTKKTTAKKTTTAKKVVAAKTATKPPALTARTVPARAKKS